MKLIGVIFTTCILMGLGMSLPYPEISNFTALPYNPEKLVPPNAPIRRYEINATTETRNIDGLYRQIYLLNGETPGPLISGNQGDWIIIDLHNYLPVPMTLHFHGIRQHTTPWSDGSAGITQWPVLSGDSFTYVFQLKDPGFFWYHGHYRGYSNDGIVGPIWSKPNSLVERPYKLVTNDTSELAEIIAQEDQPQLMLFTDFFKETYDIISTKISSFGLDPTCIRSVLMNGQGRFTCMNNITLYNAGASRLEEFYQLTSAALGTGIRTNLDTYGCLNLGPLNGFTSIEYDKALLEFPGYNTDCRNGTTDRAIVQANSTWTMFNVLNMGGEFAKTLSIDDHNITIVAVDGTFVNPVTANQISIPIGQRVTILVHTIASEHNDTSKPFAIRTAIDDVAQLLEGIGFLAYPEASNTTTIQHISEPSNGVKYQDATGSLLNGATTANPGKQKPYTADPPPTGPADKTIKMALNRLGMNTFSIYNNIPMDAGMELDHPALYSIVNDPISVRVTTNYSEAIHPTIIDLDIELGDVVDIIFQNSPSIDHPMHMHGHSFWNIAGNDSIDTFAYSSIEEAINAGFTDINFIDPPKVDNIAIKLGGWQVIRFVADNPGVWMVHCHIQTHLAAGMAAAIVEAKSNIGGVPVELESKGHAIYDSMVHVAPSELSVELT